MTVDRQNLGLQLVVHMYYGKRIKDLIFVDSKSSEKVAEITSLENFYENGVISPALSIILFQHVQNPCLGFSPHCCQHL